MNVVLRTTSSVRLYFTTALADSSEAITYFRKQESRSERGTRAKKYPLFNTTLADSLRRHMCVPYVIKLVNDIKPRQAIHANGGEPLTADQHKL